MHSKQRCWSREGAEHFKLEDWDEQICLVKRSLGLQSGYKMWCKVRRWSHEYGYIEKSFKRKWLVDTDGDPRGDKWIDSKTLRKKIKRTW